MKGEDIRERRRLTYENGELLLRKAMEGRHQLDGASHPKTLQSALCLSYALHRLWRLDEARAMVRRVAAQSSEDATLQWLCKEALRYFEATKPQPIK